jgi:hypothetical protein
MMDSLDGFVGKRVVVTEKLDGECLAARSRVSMADGSRMRIRDIVKRRLVGEAILGLDDSGAVVPSKILRVYENGRAADWIKVTARGSNGPKIVIYCTDGERFFTPGHGYVAAPQLRAGQPLSLVKHSPGINAVQRQTILGKLLGDGSLHVMHGDTAMLQFGHKRPHVDYVEWTRASLGHLARGAPCGYVSGFGSKMLKAWSACTNAIYRAFGSMVEGPKKIVPEWVVDQVEPLALAFWHMDDGTFNRNPKGRGKFQFSVCDFDANSCDVLRRVLRKFGVDSTIGVYEGYPYLMTTADGMVRLADLIAPYVPPVMQYKLPPTHRGIQASLPPQSEPAPEPYTKETTVLGVSRVARNPWNARMKYDIETETGNFFANGVLVHNCTTVYRDGLHARSLDYAPRVDRDWMRALAARIGYELPENWRLCGENLWGQHAIRYTALPSYFMVFSLWDGLRCMPWDETRVWADLLDLPTVPVLYDGPWDEDLIRGLHRDRRGPDESEGYVVRVADGFHMRDFRRCVGKYVRTGHVAGSHAYTTRRVFERNGLAAPSAGRAA